MNEEILEKESLFEIVRDKHGNLVVNLTGVDIDIGWGVTDQFWEMLIQHTEFKHNNLPEKYVSRYDEVRSILIETLKGMKKRRDK